MNLSRFFFFLGTVFFLLFAQTFYEQHVPQNVSFNATEINAALEGTEEAGTEASTTPSGLIIPSINVWLPLLVTDIKDGQWVTTKKGVSYLSNGVLPGETGNIVMYGHNWANLLGNLSKVKPGDTITLVTRTGVEEQYTVSTVQEVAPNDTSVLSQTTDKRITIYTCIGFLDSMRLVVVANQV